jgi:hypothetical protein
VTESGMPEAGIDRARVAILAVVGSAAWCRGCRMDVQCDPKQDEQ